MLSVRPFGLARHQGARYNFGFGQLEKTGFNGRGYASQALAVALAWADRHLPTPRTACIIDPENTASLYLAGKFGYQEYARSPYQNAEVILLERFRQEYQL